MLSPPNRLNVLAIAALTLTAGFSLAAYATTADITGDITTPNYEIGAPLYLSTVSIIPATGNGVTFSNGAYLANVGTTLEIGNTRDRVNGSFDAGGGILSFRLAPNATASTLSYSSSNLDVKDAAGSGQLSVNQLVLSGAEKIQLTFDGSLRNGASYRLITSDTAATGTGSAYAVTENGSGQLQTNSYVMNSSVAMDSAGLNMVLTVARGNDEYITKSGTAGHFSNPAALALGTIAAQGRQLGDLVTAINQLDINSYGYGNNAANLAIQMKRLAPVANNAYVLSAFAASDLMRQQVDERLENLRGDIPGSRKSGDGSTWVSFFDRGARQAGVDDYDGYSTRQMGLVAGFDRPTEHGWVGTSIGLSGSDIKQAGFRDGDTARMSHQQVNFMAVREFDAAFIDGMFSVGRHELDAQRATAVGRTAVGNVTMLSADLGATWGYRFKLKDGKSMITPTVGLESSSLKQPSYAESGAGDLGLAYDSKTVHRLRGKLGVRFNTESQLAGKKAFSTFHVALGHDFQMNDMDVQARYTGLTDPSYTAFTTSVESIQRNMVEVGLGTTVMTSNENSLQMRYDIQHRLGFLSQSVQIKGIWRF